MSPSGPQLLTGATSKTHTRRAHGLTRRARQRAGSSIRHRKLTRSLHVLVRTRAVHTVVHVPDAQAQAESTTARRLLSYQQQLATASSCGRETCTPRCTSQTLTSSRGEQDSTPDLQQDLAAGPQRLPDCSRSSIRPRKLTRSLHVFVRAREVHATPHITSSRGEHDSARAGSSMRHCKLTRSLHVFVRTRAVHTVVHVPDAQAQAESTTARRLLSYQQQLATASSCGREKCTPRCTSQTLTSSRGEQDSTPDLQQDLAAGPQRLPDCSRASPVHAKPHIPDPLGERDSAQAPRYAPASSPGRCTSSYGREQCTLRCTCQTHKLSRRAEQCAGPPPGPRGWTSMSSGLLSCGGARDAERETARRLLDTSPQAHLAAARLRTSPGGARDAAHPSRTSSNTSQLDLNGSLTALVQCDRELRVMHKGSLVGATGQLVALMRVKAIGSAPLCTSAYLRAHANFH
ncbi:hypothetical protein C8Q76DRAFT_797234 [Earliella scabrosa]|nr:hypothetical protein C8Q76DRAFT_797234 [Earliella scabrosa]